MTRTDEELSEMEEFIDMCCREVGKVLPFDQPGANVMSMRCYCPLGAMRPDLAPRPFAGSVSARSDWSRDEAFGFIRGFEGSETHDSEFGGHGDPIFFAMGRRFRERALAGEYVKGGAR